MLCRRKIQFFRRSPGRSYFLKKGHFQGGPRLAGDQKKLRHFGVVQLRAGQGAALVSGPGFSLLSAPSSGDRRPATSPVWGRPAVVALLGHITARGQHKATCVRRGIFFRDFPLWARDEVAASGGKKVGLCVVG